jgi:hypothetical protein
MSLAVSPQVDESFERLFIDHPLYEFTPSNFSLEIEKTVREFHCNYLEAVVKLCERYEIDYTAVPRLLTETMKDKIELDAMTLNMLKK